MKINVFHEHEKYLMWRCESENKAETQCQCSMYYIHICMYKYMYKCVHILIYVCKYMRVCLCACLSVCVHV